MRARGGTIDLGSSSLDAADWGAANVDDKVAADGRSDGASWLFVCSGLAAAGLHLRDVQSIASQPQR